MPWSTIHNIIAAAECDVLVIISCCYAGVADITSKNNHAKELITISSWNEMSDGSFTGPAIQKAVERWYKVADPSDWTGLKLHSALSNVIRETRASKIQEYLSALEVYERKVNDAKSELAKLKGLTDSDDSRQKYQREMEAWEKIVQFEKNRLEDAKKCYTQPHFLRGQDTGEGGANDEKNGERNTWRLWNAPRKEKK